MPDSSGVAGLAALAVCESLLLALNDRNVMPESAIVRVLKDAAQTLDEGPTKGRVTASHKAASALIRKIVEGRNSVRRI